MDENQNLLIEEPKPSQRKKYLRWGIYGFFITSILFIGYCFFLFQGLEQLMQQAPESHPSTIYSDTYLLKTGDLYDNTFLTERLNDCQIPFVQKDSTVQWKGRAFQYPEAVLPKDSEMRINQDDLVEVTNKEGKVDSIQVNGRTVNTIALEPSVVARLAGAQLSIRDYVKLNDIPTALLQAIIAIEDQRFLDHIGFDIRSLGRAMWINIRTRALSQGGSTLTQQLVKNLLGTREKTIFRKVKELVLAILIEVRYSKDQILEKYLNEVYFGQIGVLEIHGVSEAAKYFYGKTIDKLSVAEIALIAGVIRGPAYYSPYRHPERILERKNTVLKKMAELGLITEEELDRALHEKLIFSTPSVGTNRAPYFVDYVKAQVLEDLKERVSAEDLSNLGLQIYTTIDVPLQRRADQAVKQVVEELEARFKIERPLRLEGLLVANDPRTGFVKALVGGRSYADTTFNRVLNMKRQVGSTFKPLVYLTAFEKGQDQNGVPYTEDYMIEDAPWTHEWDEGRTHKKWSPSNYEKTFRGLIPLHEAFENSINVPMAKIGIDVGIPSVVETAKKLGIKSHLPVVPSLSLGSVELNAMELLQAYATFANRGTKVELTTVRAVVDSKGVGLARHMVAEEKVFDESLVDRLNGLLKSVVVNGTAKNMTAHGYTKAAYGKTGTTSFYRDAWFAGFSQGLSAVTWLGFDELKTPVNEDDPESKTFKSPANLTGAGAALPIWAKFFKLAVPSPLEITFPQ